MSTRRFTDQDPGTDKVIFRTATSKGAFFGATPIVQPSGSAQAAATTTVTASSPVGFVTATQASATVQLVNEMRNVLVNLGLMAGA